MRIEDVNARGEWQEAVRLLKSNFGRSAPPQEQPRARMPATRSEAALLHSAGLCCRPDGSLQEVGATTGSPQCVRRGWPTEGKLAPWTEQEELSGSTRFGA